jgi:hypothetical protein
VPLGFLLSFGLTGILFVNQEGNSEKQFKNLIFTQNIAVTAITVLFFVSIREEPKNPPSYIATRK